VRLHHITLTTGHGRPPLESTMLPQSFFDLQAPTLAARQRTGDNRIGTQANKGRIDVVLVTPAKGGRCTVTVLHPRVTVEAAIAALNAMGADAR